ncbi:hypothetical protein BCR35DRAFT_321321 [Leucosporidium creatinivorum]|uniref:PBP domain-containing protein n=1 Tax=Leucosporidium creatinivorum TaxID=106004 RepID=A0A1Y2FDQ1_9BASI|nr:hypothetical protein BCR35DRAFT_321321 [Leucosporidium creatinivorum]
MKAFVYTSLVTLLVASDAAARALVDLDPHLSARGLLTKRAIACTNSSVRASATYTGSNTTSTDVRLRISNGGAGQSGLVGALAEAYIDYALAQGIANESFAVDWITGDTTDSIKYITSGDADIAITYNAQAEYRALNLSTAVRREYGFRDHFYLLGPANNTANLTSNDTVLDIFNKIVTTGDSGNGTRFLSRYDKSATNIKESLLFATIGQIPWALATSKWYHQYPQFPLQALRAASLLGEYTLSDRGTFLTLASQNSDLTDALVLYKRGEDTDPQDLLLNPASFLLGARVCEDNLAIAQGFMDWMVLPEGGKKVVSKYVQPGSTEVLYTRAPNCTSTPAACAGW